MPFSSRKWRYYCILHRGTAYATLTRFSAFPNKLVQTISDFFFFFAFFYLTVISLPKSLFGKSTHCFLLLFYILKTDLLNCFFWTQNKHLGNFTWHVKNPSEQVQSFFLNVPHCVKIVSIRSFPGPYFPAFKLNTEICSAIQSKGGKILTRKTQNTGNFKTVPFSSLHDWTSLLLFEFLFSSRRNQRSVFRNQSSIYNGAFCGNS